MDESQGGASARIDAEFARIRRELGDLPGVVSSPARLRRMLAHLTKTLYPGILNDCFYQSATAVCRKQAKALGRPCRCTTCACTARTRAAQACTFPASPWPATRPPRRWTSPHRRRRPATAERVALQTHIADLDRVISELQLRDAPDGEEADPADA